MPQATTAILLFSRSAHEEALAKSFGAGPAGDRRVAEALIRRTESTLQRSGLPVLRSDEHSQRGRTFGERLGNAITDAFATGIDHLIVVGNDCPDLTARHLRAAARMLQNGRNILGPDHRGGAWLLGLQRHNFDRDRFVRLSWESDHLLEELRALYPAAESLHRLADLNQIKDLRRHWWRLRAYFAHLAVLLLPPRQARSAGLQPMSIFGQFSSPLRGPPELA